jgi:hypothetical protein
MTAFPSDIRPRLKGSRRGRPSAWSLAELISLGLFRYWLNIQDLKHFYWHLTSHYGGWFRLPNYPNLVAQIKRVTGYVLGLLGWILQDHRQQQAEGPSFIDPSALKVCENGRISEHKGCAGLARRGTTTPGWFYGFKLGLVVDALGPLFSVAIRPGTTDDRKFLPVLFRGLHGWAVGDAGLLSQEWREKLWDTPELFFLTEGKKSMKRLRPWTQPALLKRRQQVETRLSQLKHRIQQAVTLARSPLGYFSRWIYPLLAYCLFPKLAKAF